MSISIGVNRRASYVGDDDVPHIAGQDILDVAYQTAHGYQGGVSALAARMGVVPGTLLNKVNPNNNSHHLTLREAVELMELSDDPALLQAIAARLGCTVIPALPDQSEGDPVQAMAELGMAQGDFMNYVGQALGNGPHCTANQVRGVDEMASRFIAVIGHTVAMVRRRMRKAPTHFADQ
ncbi:MAG: phage regulatory CII family protein [Comamonas sp.]